MRVKWRLYPRATETGSSALRSHYVRARELFAGFPVTLASAWEALPPYPSLSPSSRCQSSSFLSSVSIPETPESPPLGLHLRLLRGTKTRQTETRVKGASTEPDQKQVVLPKHHQVDSQLPVGSVSQGGWETWGSHPELLSPARLWQPSSWVGMSWWLTQEGRAAAERVGEFLPLLDL